MLNYTEDKSGRSISSDVVKHVSDLRCEQWRYAGCQINQQTKALLIIAMEIKKKAEGLILNV